MNGLRVKTSSSGTDGQGSATGRLRVDHVNEVTPSRVELPPPVASIHREPIRVLHVVEAFGGGVFEQLRALTSKLTAHGVNSALAFGRRPETPEDPGVLFEAGVDLYPLAWGQRTWRQTLGVRAELRRIYRSWEPDVIHLHSSFAGVAGALTKPQNVPIVYTPHGYSFLQTDASPLAMRMFLAAEKVTAARVDLIGAVSESEARAALRVTSRAKVRIMRNGVPQLDSPSVYRKTEEPRPVVAAMGRISEARRHLMTAEILRSVSDLADVVWIGDAVDPSYREDVEQAGVSVTGWLAHDDAVRRLGEALVYVHCAAWDGQPLSVLEAMGVGTAVVGTDIDPLRELLPPERRFSSVAEASSQIRSLLQDPVRLDAALSSQSQLRYRYSAEAMAERWSGLYHDLAMNATLDSMACVS